MERFVLGFFFHFISLISDNAIIQVYPSFNKLEFRTINMIKMCLGCLSKKWSLSQRKVIPLVPAKLCLSKWVILMFGVFWIP